MNKLILIPLMLILLSLTTIGATINMSDTGDISVNGTTTTEGLILTSAGYTKLNGANVFNYSTIAVYETGTRGIHIVGSGAETQYYQTLAMNSITSGTLVFDFKAGGVAGANDFIGVGFKNTADCQSGFIFGIDEADADGTKYSGYDYAYGGNGFASNLSVDTEWHHFMITVNSSNLVVYNNNFSTPIYTDTGDNSAKNKGICIRATNMDYATYIDNIYLCNGIGDCSINLLVDTLNLSTPAPASYSNFLVHTININITGNFTDNAIVGNTNCSLYLNGTINQTNIFDGTTNYNTAFNTITQPDGYYKYQINCSDNTTSELTTASYYTIDTTDPLVFSNISGANVSLLGYFLINASDTNLKNITINSSCNYNYTNTSISSPFSLSFTENATVCTPGAYNTTVTIYDYAGNYNTTIYYWNLIYNAQVIVYAKDFITGNNISSFTVLTNDSRSFSSVNNITIIPGVKNYVYGLEIYPTGYAYGYHNLTLNETYLTYGFSLYSINSINITIYKENSSLITENVNIKFTNNATEFNNISIGPNFYIDNLTSGEWLLTFSLEDYYISRTYTITVNNNSHQFLSAYLTNSSKTTIFTVTDEDTAEVLNNVLGTMYKNIGGSWEPIESKYTDITGKIQFTYTSDTNYRFYLSKENYQDNIFFLNPILFSTYDVKMAKSTSAINYSADYDGVSLVYAPSIFYNSVANNFNFLIASPSGSLTEYGINLTYPGGSNYTSDTNAIGGQLSVYITPNASTVFDTVRLDYYYISTLSGRREFTVYLPISLLNATAPGNTFMDNKNKTYGLGIFERILIATLIVLFVVGIATMVGQPIPGLALGLFMFGFMVYIGFIPIWSILPSMSIGLLFLIWKSGGY